MPKTLRAQFLLLISALLLLTIGAVISASIWNARRGVLEQVELDGKVVASLIHNAVVLARKLPEDMEAAVGAEMLSTAVAVSHYVALASRAGLAPETINQSLRRIVQQATIDEIWVTDSRGLSVINTDGDRFQFSPDDAANPQAAAFWGLLTGETRSVIQSTQPRDKDQRLFKYVGTGGIDQPRIVQVGSPAEYMNELRELVGLERLARSLVAEGYIHQLLVVDEGLAPLAYASTDWRPPAPLGAEQKSAMQQVLAEGGSRLRLAPDAIELYSGMHKGDGLPNAAFMARFSRMNMDALLARQTEWSLAAGGLAFIIGALLSIAFARRLTQPLEAVSRAARRVEGGQLGDTVELNTLAARTDELGRLGRVFRSMAAEVRNREQILDGLVQTRTRELAVKNAALEAAQATIDEELTLARQLQFSIVPARFPDTPDCSGAARMLPATHMGGDFYDFIPLPDGRIGLVMADVAGKGVAAAFLMAVARTRLLALALEHADPADCLRAANSVLCANNPLTLFITVFYGILDPRTGELHYANGGHPPPLLRRADGAVSALAGTSGVALGILPDLPYGVATARLQPGDLLLMFTDGVTEAFDVAGRAYGDDRLRDLLAGHAAGDATVLVEAVFADVAAHATGAPQSDDITVAALGWRLEPTPPLKDTR